MKDSRVLAVVMGPVLTGLLYFIAAIEALYLTDGTDGIATVWPASGILLATLLLAPRPTLMGYIAAGAIASMVANMVTGNALATAAGFTLANVVESVVVAWILRGRRGWRSSFVDSANLARFCLACLIGAAISAGLATGAAPAASPAFMVSWFMTDLLGMLVVTPMVLIVADLWQRGNLIQARGRMVEVAGLMALVVAATAVTFLQSTFPLLFLPMTALLIAVFRLGPFGAAASVFVIGIGSSLATVFDSGPIHLIHGSMTTETLFLQFYLLALFASALPVAALLAARARLAASIAEGNRLLRMAESVAGFGHWRIDMTDGTLFWSDEVFRIHGIPVGTPVALSGAIDAYHPDDRAMVAATLERMHKAGDSFAFSARLLCPGGGGVRHVACRGEANPGATDDAIILFGVMQDVTAQVTARDALEQARVAAVAAARDATRRAETDELTGLANRRHLLAMLDRAIDMAAATNGNLAIAMFDVDHFKRVNDTFGHATGDDVLRRVAHSALSVLRDGDVLGRIGGEEFVLILPGAGPDRAYDVAERVRVAIVAGNDGTGLPPVSASFGIATWHVGEPAGSLIRRADAALYQAKSAGRNTLRIAA